MSHYSQSRIIVGITKALKQVFKKKGYIMPHSTQNQIQIQLHGVALIPNSMSAYDKRKLRQELYAVLQQMGITAIDRGYRRDDYQLDIYPNVSQKEILAATDLVLFFKDVIIKTSIGLQEFVCINDARLRFTQSFMNEGPNLCITT